MHLLLDSFVMMEMFSTCSFCPHHLPRRPSHLKSAAGLLWSADPSLLSSEELPELRSACQSSGKGPFPWLGQLGPCWMMHGVPSGTVVSAARQLSPQHEALHVRQCAWPEASLLLELLDPGLAALPKEKHLLQCW